MVPGATGYPVPPGWALLAELPGGSLENNCSSVCLSSDRARQGPAAPAESSGQCAQYHNSILFPAPVPREQLGLAGSAKARQQVSQSPPAVMNSLLGAALLGHLQSPSPTPPAKTL